MRRSNAIQYLRHVASLGLGGKVAIPEMLNALADIVPGSFNSFFWLDPQCRLADAYAPTALLGPYEALVVNYDQLRASDEPTFDKIVDIGLEVGSARALHAMKDYSRSVIRNEVWRPFGIGLGLDLVLREAGKPRAILFVNRDARQSHFRESEAVALLELRQHFLHALTGAELTDYDVDEQETDIGVIVVDPQGEITSMSPAALRIMVEFMDLPFSPGMVLWRIARELPAPLRVLLDRLERVKGGAPTQPALLERRTSRGVYRAKAFPQAPIGGDSPDLATIVMTRHLPRAVGVLRRVTAMNLSPRERQLAYQIGVGLDPNAAAAAIGVTPTTGRSYLKSIYQKLDVQGRPGLVAALRSGGLSH